MGNVFYKNKKCIQHVTIHSQIMYSISFKAICSSSKQIIYKVMHPLNKPYILNLTMHSQHKTSEGGVLLSQPTNSLSTLFIDS